MTAPRIKGTQYKRDDESLGPHHPYERQVGVEAHLERNT